MEGRTLSPVAYRELLRQRLADATLRLQWTYSVFWTFCPDQQILVWGEGYLNGAESTELNLRRSRQLQELFTAINLTQQSSGASVSLHELTQPEWFYMCSMAYSFATGAGLPGRAFARKSHVWHCIREQRVEDDSREFVRAQLAQRARIQTIVCVPALDGVLEFGTTTLVEEAPSLLQQMQSVFSEQPASTMVGIQSSLPPGQARETPERSQRRSSAFKRWAPPHRQQLLPSYRQRMLRTALLTIPRLYAVKKEVDEYAARAGGLRGSHTSGGSSHVIAERRRREKLNHSFVTLRGLVPLATKPDKVSLLGDTIEYVRALQRRVEELESDGQNSERANARQQVEVNVANNIATLKISSPWKDSLLIDILQTINDLQLEVVDASAKVSDGVLNAILKAKVTSAEDEKTAEIQAAILNAIEAKLSDRVLVH